MTKRTLMIGARLVFGVLTLVAIGVQLVTLLRLGAFNPLNFFSYFTNLSNIFAAIVLLVGAAYLIRRREPTPTEDLIRGASVVAMAIVGIVFSVLLRDVDLGHLLPWVNLVLHYIMPVVVVADWLILPPKSKLSFGQTTYWLIYPLIYLVYTLIRGPIAKFYPYPFLDPAHAGGYGGVALYCVAIFGVFLVVGALLRFLGNTLTRRV
jgi:hypothetical protein